MSKEMTASKSPVGLLKQIVNSDSVKQRLQDALRDQAGLFSMSVIDLYASDTYLQKCDPNLVMAECMKAAALKLPVSKGLGYAYVVPYGNKPTFQIGYKGMIQLAMRTGQFKRMNADCVYEGEVVKTDRISGDVEIVGTPSGEKAIGYFAHMELTNGFTKTVYWTHDKVIAHAKKFSKSFNSKSSAWVTDTEAMCLKTVVRALLSKWAPMSIEFLNTMNDDSSSSSENIGATIETIDPPEEIPEKKKRKKKEVKEDVVDAQFEDIPPVNDEPGY